MMYVKSSSDLSVDPATEELIQCTDEQAMLIDSAQKFCRDHSNSASARKLIDSKSGFDEGVWSEMANMGWTGLILPEEFGGSNLPLADLVPVVEEAGRAMMHTPIQAVTLAALALLRSGTSEQQQAFLPFIADGGIVTVALSDANHWDFDRPLCTATRTNGKLSLYGTKRFVADLSEAKAVIASVQLDGAPALVLIPRSAISDSAIKRQVVVDEFKRCFRLDLEGIELPEIQLLSVGDAAATIRQISLAGTLLLSAEMVGGQAGAIDLLVDYLTTRKTFGRYIGSYQGLKHPMAAILNDYEDGRSHLYYAATEYARDAESKSTEIAVRMTKAWMSDKYLYVGDRAVQFHGGMGFTWECDAQLVMRRALFAQSQFGDAMHHNKRLADLMLGTIDSISAVA